MSINKKLRIRFKNPTVQFSGSVIQQNYGEQQEKGFLFWVIENRENFASKFVPVANASPFVTLQYDGSIDKLLTAAENYPETSRFRIKIDGHVNSGELSQIKGALKSNFKPTEIVFKHEDVKQDVKNQTSDTYNVDTFEDANNLIMDFHSNTNISDSVKETMTSLLKSAWVSAKIDDSCKGGKFHIKKMEFDNTFGYGEGNVINFDATEGITGIFGKNRSGKSSICGTLAYGLFNGTDRGPLKNIHIVNARKNFCNVKIDFSKAGIDYALERQTVKVSNKKGTWAVTDLNLFEVDAKNDQRKDLSEEQRRETEKVLRDLVGNLDDFLLTSLSSQGNVNKFIDLNAGARKAYLARFLKLDMFDKLNDSLKEELAITKRLLDSVPEKEFDSVIAEIENKLKTRKKQREETLSDIDKLKVQIDELAVVLATQSTEAYTKNEVDEQMQLVQRSKEKLDKCEENVKLLLAKIAGLKTRKKELSEQIAESNEKELNLKKLERDEISKCIEKTEQKAEKKNDEINRDISEVKKLNDVPCEDKFPTCKYIISAKAAKTSLEKKQAEHAELNSELAALKKSYAHLLKDVIDEKLAELRTVKDKIAALEIEKGKFELDLSKTKSNIEILQKSLDVDNRKLDTMRANVCDENAAKERDEMLSRKKRLEESIRVSQLTLSKLSEQIGTASAELIQTKKKKDEFEVRSHKNKALRHLNKALSKNGIPLSVVRKKLPQINAELTNILQPSVGFSIELESDEESNDMEIYINYGDSRRVIECGSGMEKMMSSIAIRAALINVSNLPKSDIFIVDEGFGALDGKNLEACTALLRELTKYFKSIIVISHVDTIKDVVDNVIEIDNKGMDSYVCFD